MQACETGSCKKLSDLFFEYRHKKKLALPISYAQYTKSKTMLVQIFVFKKNLVEEQLICFFLHFFLSTFNQEKTNKIFIWTLIYALVALGLLYEAVKETWCCNTFLGHFWGLCNLMLPSCIFYVYLILKPRPRSWLRILFPPVWTGGRGKPFTWWRSLAR